MTYKVRLWFGIFAEVDHSTDIQESGVWMYRKWVLLLQIYQHNDSTDVSLSGSRKKMYSHHEEDKSCHVEPSARLYSAVRSGDERTVLSARTQKYLIFQSLSVYDNRSCHCLAHLLVKSAD